jgi:DNA replication protein DnaC
VRREKLGYLEFLGRLLAAELEERRERKIDMLTRFAGFPYRKSLEQFDFEFQPTVDRRLIRDLATLRFLEHGENILIVGPPGTGKTMLSVGLGLKAAEAGRRVLFLTADDLVPEQRHQSLAARAALRRQQCENRERLPVSGDPVQRSTVVLDGDSTKGA